SQSGQSGSAKLHGPRRLCRRRSSASPDRGAGAQRRSHPRIRQGDQIPTAGTTRPMRADHSGHCVRRHLHNNCNLYEGKMPPNQQLKLPEEGSLAASTIPSGAAVPRLLYLADVPVESYMHGSSLVYRLFESYPAENADRGRLVRIPGRPPPTKCPVLRYQIKLVPVAEKSVQPLLMASQPCTCVSLFAFDFANCA